MREEPTRSLLLLDANPEERRLISAIAGRAGWSVVGAGGILALFAGIRWLLIRAKMRPV